MDTMAVFRQFLTDLPTIIIEPLLGQTGAGAPKYGPPVEVEAVVDQTRRRVLDATGSLVTSESTSVVDEATHCPDGSRITLPDGQVTYSIITKRARDHGQDALPAHAEISCQ